MGAESLADGVSGALARRRRAVRPGVVLLVASMGVFMAFMDDTVVGIAFPNLVRSFPQVTFAELSWVLNAYNITFAALLVPAGRLADLVGRRRTFASGVLLFTVASALCAVSPTVDALIAARAVQGIGAAVIVPSSLALVLEAFTPERRAQAVGMWSATAALAAGLGPSIGGLLVEIQNWRLVFLVNIPIGIVSWRLCGRELVESRAPGRRELPDIAGAGLLALAVAALVLGIVQGPDRGWTSAAVIAAAIVALTAGTALARRSRQHASPVIDPELVRMPGFPVVGAITAVGSAGFFALGLANLLFLMVVWRYSPLKAGLAITPAPFVAAVTALLAGRLVGRWDARRLVLIGSVVWTAGPLILLSRMGPHPDYLGAYLPAAIVLAVGVGIGFPLVSDAAVSGAPRGRFAGASALNSTIRQVGATVGVAILAAFIGTAAETGLASPFRRVWVFAAVCFGLVAVGSLALPRFDAPALDSEDDLVRQRSVVRSRSPTHRLPPATPARSRAPTPQTAEELLSEVTLFATLPATILGSLARRCMTVRLASGEWLFRHEDPADAMYVLQTGRLEVMGELVGRPEHVVRELGVGSVVGELALLSHAHRNASIRVRRDAVLLRLAQEDFDALMLEAPTFAQTVARVLGRQLQASHRPEAQARQSATTVAVVSLSKASSAIEMALVSELQTLSRVAWLDQARAGELISGADLGTGLAQVLDHLERDHELVLLLASSVSGEWASACIRQADRVLALIEDGGDSAQAPSPHLRGCDAVLLDRGDRPAVRSLLDALAPRSTHRIRDDARRTDDVARLARRLAGRSVGLVLSGGGARGFAHVGVIEELLAAGVTIDRVGGASMGAFVGGLLAMGMDAAAIDAHCYEEWVRRNPLADYRLPRTSLIRGARAWAMVERTLPGLIEDLPHSFYCVSTDIIAAELVVHRRGELAPAVAASMCLPGVVPPVHIGNRLLVDGGLLDNLPVATMAEEAEGPIIACDVTEPEQRSLAAGETPPTPGLIDTLARVMMLSTTDTLEHARRYADLVITPEHESIGRLEFHSLDRMRESGRRAALAALESAPGRLWG
jgi:NTE family protein